MNNLSIGIYNDLEATLVEGVAYISGSDTTQDIVIKPSDIKRWPTNIAQHFTNSPCFMYMTFFSPATENSAVYQVAFDDSLTVDADGNITTRALLVERTSYDGDVAGFTWWEEGTVVSATTNAQLFHTFETADDALSAKISASNTALETLNTELDRQGVAILTNEANILINKNAADVLAQVNTEQDVKIQVNTDNIAVHQSMLTVTPGAGKVPVSLSDGTINPNWVPGYVDTLGDVTTLREDTDMLLTRVSNTTTVDNGINTRFTRTEWAPDSDGRVYVTISGYSSQGNVFLGVLLTDTTCICSDTPSGTTTSFVNSSCRLGAVDGSSVLLRYANYIVPTYSSGSTTYAIRRNADTTTSGPYYTFYITGYLAQ